MIALELVPPTGCGRGAAEQRVRLLLGADDDACGADDDAGAGDIACSASAPAAPPAPLLAPALPPPPPSPQRGGSPWVLTVNALALLFAESTRGLVLGSQFAFLAAAAAGEGDAAALLGAAVASFSAGRLASSFVFGWLSESGFPYSALLQLTFLCTLLGQTLYVGADAMPRGLPAAVAIVVSRAVIGFGSGILPTTRSVVVECTPVERRMREYARLGFAKYVGYAITPGLGAVLNMDFTLQGRFHVNAFTAPAWIHMALCVVGIAMVRATFDADFRTVAKKKAGAGTTAAAAIGSGAGADNAAAPPSLLARGARLCSLGYLQSLHGEPEDATTPLVFWAFLLFLALNLVTKGALASAEASLAPQYEAAAKAAAAGGEPPAQETLVDRTATFALYLGLVGLVSYLLMALKPTRAPAAPAVALKPTQMPATAAAAPAVPAASSGGAAAPLLPRKVPAAQAAEETESLSDAPTLAARIAAWMSAHADELDVLLLMVSLALTLAGGVLVAPLDWSGASGLREVAVGLDRLTAGMAMLWSLGAPICDVLAVSMFSVIYSSVRPGSSRSMTTAALASVAWPHSGISTSGVNQRSRYCPSCGTRNAVSDRLFSAAIACSSAVSGNASSTTTAAGLPPNSRFVKAST